MSELRRLIDQAAPGSLRHALLRAGRRAEPSASAPRELTERLLAQFGEVAADTALSQAALSQPAAAPMAAAKLGAVASQGLLLLGLGAAALVVTVGLKDAPDATVMAVFASEPVKRNTPALTLVAPV